MTLVGSLKVGGRFGDWLSRESLTMDNTNGNVVDDDGEDKDDTIIIIKRGQMSIPLSVSPIH